MAVRDMLVAFGRRIRRFPADDRGSVTVEFVIALPLLLGILAFAVQYGYAMQVRNALDVAVRDAARYLSRAPYDPATGSVDATFINKASTLVQTRVVGAGSVVMPTPTFTETCVAGEPVVRVAVSVSATVSLSIFSAIAYITGNSGADRLTMTATENWVSSDKSRNTCAGT